MRSRNIKPGFFINEQLAEVDYQTRLLFIGLWCFADRAGRFEWIPKRIKVAIFPYDNIKVDKMLCNLMSLHLITRHDNIGYIENFSKHQHPHPHEAKSTLPKKPEQNQCHDMSCNVTKCQADIIIPDIIIPDTTFDTFYKAYPKHKGKEEAKKVWLKIRPDELLLQVILKSIEDLKKTDQWQKEKGQFIPHPATWLNQKRWEDEIEIKGLSPSKTRFINGVEYDGPYKVIK